MRTNFVVIYCWELYKLVYHTQAQAHEGHPPQEHMVDSTAHHDCQNEKQQPKRCENKIGHHNDGHALPSTFRSPQRYVNGHMDEASNSRPDKSFQYKL